MDHSPPFAPWAEDRLTRSAPARAQFKAARAQMAALWGRALEVGCLGHHPLPGAVAGSGQFLALEGGALLLSTLDLGAGRISWRFAPRSEACGATALLMIRAIRGAELGFEGPHASGFLDRDDTEPGDDTEAGEGPDGGSGVILPAGQIALVPMRAGVALHLPAGGRCDIGILTRAPAAMTGPAILGGSLASAHHLAFVAGYMLRAAPHPPGRSTELGRMLVQTLEHVAADLALRRADEGESFFERFKFLVAANIGRADLALEDIARGMSVSPRQLQRLLKARGTSFRSHLQNSRLTMAHELLANGEGRIRVADLAYRCGFNDPNYFSRAYARHWKVPPSRS